MRKTVTMLLPVIFLLIILLGALLGVTRMLYAADTTPPTAEYFLGGKGRAVLLSTGEGGIFPSQAGLSDRELKAELDALLDSAEAQGFEAVYYEAAGSTAFFRSHTLPHDPSWAGDQGFFALFDPLSYLCGGAAQRGLELYAVADAAQWQDPILCDELARYRLAGVVLTGTEALDDPEDFCRAAAHALNQRNADAAFGLALQAESADAESAAELAREGLLDLVHLQVGPDPEDPRPSFGDLLDEWGDALEPTGTPMVLLQPLGNLTDTQNRDVLGLRLLMASMDPRVGGCLFDDAAALRQFPAGGELAVSHFSPGGALPDLQLSFEQELAVYAPAEPEIWLDNSYTTYFLSGTSDPDLPLTLNGEELERISTNGVWGVQVELREGTNRFILAQDETTAEVTVEVYNPNRATPKAIDRITESTRFPTCDRVFREGEELTFTCVAPSGAVVTAQVGSRTLTMRQRAATALPGIPATFEASLVLPATAADEVVSLGQVGYTLNHNGTKQEYTSAGRLLVAGQEAQIVAQVGQYMTALYTAPTGEGGVAANLNPGTALRLSGTHRSGRELLEGAELYVPAADITILTGRQEIQQYYQDIQLRPVQKGEELVLGGGLNACFPDYENGVLTLTLSDTLIEGADSGLTLLEQNPADLSQNKIEPTSGLFAGITAQNMPDGSAVLRMELLPGVSLAGWDVYLNENGQAVVYCQRMAVLSHSYARPLEGVTVMVDPGHGGSDIGAAGAAGAGGPTEAQVNLALSHALRYRLEQLGATVVMTQSDNSRITIQERYLLTQRLRPDLYLSVHHNSLAVTRDANEVFFTTAYYYYPQSEQLAQAAVEAVSRRTGRDAVEAQQAAYYVTRTTALPAILFETGFVSNPAEQQDCCDPITICKTACALADAVTAALEQPYLRPLG